MAVGNRLATQPKNIAQVRLKTVPRGSSIVCTANADWVTQMLAYLTIFAASVSGFAGAPVYVVGLATLALASLSYAEHYSIYQRGSENGLFDLVDTTLIGSLFNAVAASGAAFGAGAALSFIGT
jgi:hypothetical protein